MGYSNSKFSRIKSGVLIKIGLKNNVITEKNYLKFFKTNSLKNNLFVDGYWQNEKFFKEVRDDIRKIYQFPKKLDSINARFLAEIIKTNSVSLHVRRTDYVNNVMNRSIYGVVTLDYYHNAINYIKNILEDINLFVFSDDLDWCRRNLGSFHQNIQYISHNKGDDAYKDMMLMSKCKANIIANSSFSWWGAWLGNKAKLTLSPKKWNSNLMSCDVVLKDWVKL